MQSEVQTLTRFHLADGARGEEGEDKQRLCKKEDCSGRPVEPVEKRVSVYFSLNVISISAWDWGGLSRLFHITQDIITNFNSANQTQFPLNAHTPN